MAIRLRTYRSPEDLDLQKAFWIQVTQDLPWCWKPTNSPALYATGPQFDPRSRCFAFDDDRLVGYMSFTGHGNFVSLGYPWVLSEYEGELQDRLYDAVYGFAANPEYGGKTFAQRFRKQWTAQISFFERHGFVVQRSEPIYVLDLRIAGASRAPSRCHIDSPVPFCWADFRELSAARLSAQQLSMWKDYFQTVEFDFAVKATREGMPAAYLGIAIRSDTGFAELIAVAVEPNAVDVFASCLVVAAGHTRLRKAKYLGTKSIPLDGTVEVLAQVGFERVSEDLHLSKSI